MGLTLLKGSLFGLLLLLVEESITSFSIPDAPRQVVSRKTFATEAMLGIAAMTSGPTVSKAAIAGDPTDTQRAALKSVKRAQKQLLNKVEAQISFKEYEEAKGELRTAPLGNVRKNAFTVVKADEEALQGLYTDFITSVEAFDNLTGQLLRGRNLSDEKMYQAYQTMCTTLEAFLKAAEPLVPGTVPPPVPEAAVGTFS
jgi:hypothetical protein